LLTVEDIEKAEIKLIPAASSGEFDPGEIKKVRMTRK